ncbi:hypothetical protein, variant [Blastomyces dermatitidis ER-3]|uniref:Uncharacterized protein n=1 Tax=Ajellomyces dermatitidis (strain ER-3 / ATCC MYA-2586) TaxID=559297 RepID=A0ABX2VSW8_AJEDR|nr:uncharacterized protein BDCG_16481 [Blastomyces dermatitidis ER-3]XP_045279847.1 hypothetical protein, variant [Blastomyces dermatitidis ER-3]OAT00119.1 hypothetical protein BDCG_16481 [Blastomyces dermatitidis ER-3]OAT00120.1 hypothetical protein, variant [Blastomyces dermatitidis ER-3]
MKLVPLPVFRPANAERLGLHRSFFQTGTERRMAWRSLNLEGELMESELPQTTSRKRRKSNSAKIIFFLEVGRSGCIGATSPAGFRYGSDTPQQFVLVQLVRNSA